jgi:rhodanese-related sulfurtransferase
MRLRVLSALAVMAAALAIFQQVPCPAAESAGASQAWKTQEKVVIKGMDVTRESPPKESAPVTVAGRKPCEFDKLCEEAVTINGVKCITYEQFQRLRSSKDGYVLVDVLSSDDYGTGHIPGAVSLPIATISMYNAVNKIPMGSNVVVYCLDSNCPYSSDAARKLSGFGYRVLAYKGGLDEWRQKGQRIERN